MKIFLEWILSLFVKEKKVDKKLLKARIEEPKIIPIGYKNDNIRLINEYIELKDQNLELYNILDGLNTYTNEEFKKNIVITMIYRTQAEQEYLYRNSKRYAQKKFKSPHQFMQGVDIRSRTFTQSEIKQIVAWLNQNKQRGNYYKWVAKCHDVGSGRHFHIQYVKK